MPDVILATTTPGVAALRQQTGTIPIVFVFVADPVGQGFVQSLARPGGNVTGFSSFDTALLGKWLQLLKEVAPGLTRVTAIFNLDTTPYEFFNRGIEPAGTSLGMTVTPAPVHDEAAIEEVTAAQGREPGGSLIILPDSFNEAHRECNHRRSNPSPFALDRREHVSQIWRPDVLLDRPSRPVRSGSILHRPHPQGCQSS
jgi:putative tryptophan/tyrosine transport system substrate-binding protein